MRPLPSGARAFDDRAALYAAARPAYADAFLDELFRAWGLPAGCTAADIGAGTGKFARQLLARGAAVYCVEPSPAMLAQARQALAPYPAARFLAGDASAIPLPDASVDLVTAAQAFHWFEPLGFRQECRRILRPGGLAALVWNTRDTSAPLVQALEALALRHCPRFRGFSGGLQADDPRIGAFFGGAYEKRVYPHPLRYDQAGFLRRELSSSYAPAPQDPGYAAYTQALQELFAAYAADGSLTMPNHTVAYLGQPL